jgi:hypothetical protein
MCCFGIRRRTTATVALSPFSKVSPLPYPKNFGKTSAGRRIASIMVVTHQFSCGCGENTISLSFSNMPAEVIDRVYGPNCDKNGHPHQKAWPLPGDWFVHFDLEVAIFFALAKLEIDPALVNSGFIMDRGFVH